MRGHDQALMLIAWLRVRRSEFTVSDLAGGLGVRKRTAYRLILVAEARGLIELSREAIKGGAASPALWQSQLRVELP